MEFKLKSAKFGHKVKDGSPTLTSLLRPPWAMEMVIELVDANREDFADPENHERMYHALHAALDAALEKHGLSVKNRTTTEVSL